MSSDWRVRAACADVADPEVFFPVAVSGPAYARQVATAKRVCAGCPVRVECLAFAVAGLTEGVAGGLTAEERRGLGTPVEPGPVSAPVAGSRRERADAGRRAIRSGRAVTEVAAEFEVSERTAMRWAAEVRQEQARERCERGAA